MATTMVADDKDNDVYGNGALGNEVDNDGVSATGNDNGDDNGVDDNDGNGNGTMGSGATGYNHGNDGNG